MADSEPQATESQAPHKLSLNQKTSYFHGLTISVLHIKSCRTRDLTLCLLILQTWSFI